ncbi:MAG: GHMP kinase [Elusimicrobia bacterium]|nr:GHMP kinase [Elusimicrobiota bacterium]
MIISRTPFRVSLAGGGTDLAEFYHRSSGAVVSTAIDKYMYITVNKYFDDSIILKYSRTELVASVDEVEHPLLRECLKRVGIQRGIEITSMADVVGGTGLGSSSSFTVGVLHALYAFLGKFKTQEQLAQEACEIEIQRLKEPIGKQDQYIAAYGGFQFLEFMPDETVRVDPLICPVRTLDRLQEHLVLVYSGLTRKAGPILRRARAGFKRNDDVLRKMREQASVLRAELQKGHVEAVGPVLREAWELKKSLAGGITNPQIDEAYGAALKGGAIGGKILGAGGGGFLLLFCPPAQRKKMLGRMPGGWREIGFRFEPEGSKIIYVSK